MIRNSLIALLLLVCCSKCHAQQVRLRVHAETGGMKSIGYGGCVRIGVSKKNNNWLYATAAHNVNGVDRIELLLDGKWQHVNVVATDNKNDIAVIVSFPAKENLRSYVIGKDAVAGEKVQLKGLYLGKEKRDIWGKVISSNVVLTTDKSVIVGDSGCPYFRKNSELVGIQSAKIPQTKKAIMVPASQLKALLIRTLGYIPPQPKPRKSKQPPLATTEKPPVLPKSKGKDASRIIMFSGSKCSTCQKWKQNELPQLNDMTIEIIEDDGVRAKQAGVTSYPTFIAIQSKKEIARKVGYPSAADVKAMLPAKDTTCLQCLPLKINACGECKQRFTSLSQQIKSLNKTIVLMNAELSTLRNRPNQSKEISQLQTQLHQTNLRIKALEPLLKRRLILESSTGKVSAERTYQPHEAMRIRGIYRSKVHDK